MILSTLWGSSKKAAICKPDTESMHTLILDFSASRTVQKIYVLYQPLTIWYSVMASQADPERLKNVRLFFFFFFTKIRQKSCKRESPMTILLTNAKRKILKTNFGKLDPVVYRTVFKRERCLFFYTHSFCCFLECCSFKHPSHTNDSQNISTISSTDQRKSQFHNAKPGSIQ